MALLPAIQQFTNQTICFMIKNYFKIAWRNLWKNKTFSAINIFGLSIGIAAFLLIVNYLRFEYSFDDAHLKKDRIFRVPMSTTEKEGKQQTFAFTYRLWRQR